MLSPICKDARTGPRTSTDRFRLVLIFLTTGRANYGPKIRSTNQTNYGPKIRTTDRTNYGLGIPGPWARLEILLRNSGL